MTHPTTDASTDTDTELHELMTRALADLDTPTDRLHAGSLSRGRSVRRRRRTVLALGGLAAMVLAGAIALPSVAGSEDADHLIAQDGTTPSPDTYVRPVGWWDMPGRVMRDRLASLLPEAASVTDVNLGAEELGMDEEYTGGWVQVDVLDRGEPAGGMNVVLYPPFERSSFAEDVTTCPGNSPEADACTELEEDGEVVGRIVRWETAGVVTLEATRLLPDGGLVYAAASNSSDDKWGAGSTIDRPAPLLRAAELRAVAASPTWQDWSPRG